MRYPEFLKENGSIGFVAPSFGCVIEPYHSAFLHAIDKFKDQGHEVILGPNCFEDKGIGISNEPALCGKELNDMYCDSQAEVLISCGGGELMCEVVPFIDFKRIGESRPKWYMGYSDNTNFTFLSATLSDTAAIYGPCAGTFGMEPRHESVEDAYRLLRGQLDHTHGYDKWEREAIKDEENPLVPYNLTEPTIISRFPDEDVRLEGRLLGGCIDCLVNLLGTRYDKVKEFNERYREDGVIWFLEACDLNVMSIRRSLWNMKEAGWFDTAKGFLIGRPMCYGEEAFGIDHRQAVTAIIGELGVPVIMDLDIGHLPPMMPLVCGASARVSVEKNAIDLVYTWK